MSIFNKTLLLGRLTSDVEVKQTTSGKAVARFTVAVNNGKDKNGEDMTAFVPCTAWGATAEFIKRWFAKGKPIIVEGSLRNNNYEDKNGVKHYSLDLTIETVGFVPSEKHGDNNISGFEEIEGTDELL